MARKKTSRKRKVTATRKSTSKKLVKKKSAVKKKAAARKKPAKKKAVRRKASRRPVRQETTFPVALRGRGFDAASGGQAGDTQGLSRREDEDSESVTELAEEGQYFEAGAVSGVEDAKDPDEGEVTTSEVPEDDVPEEYTDRD